MALIGLGLSIGLLSNALAQPQSQPAPIVMQAINTVTVRNFDVDDGLPQNSVHAIAQTSDGFLWVATWEGVARFNGQTFRVFDHTTTPAISTGGVRALLADQHDGLWLGMSENGVTRLVDGIGSDGLRRPELASDQALALAQDASGRLYVGTADHGVYAVNGNEVEILSDPGHRILGLAIDAQSRLLVATHIGLQRIDPLSGNIEDLGGGQARAVITTAAGMTLVGGDQGLAQLIGDALKPIALPATLDGASITSMVADAENRLWFGTQSDGLFRATLRADGTIERIESLGIAEGLPNLRVLSLKFDAAQTLWVGSNGGLTRVIETGIEKLGPTQGLDSPFARAIVQSKNGELFVGTSGGLFRYRNPNSEPRLAERIGEVASISTLALDPSGALWIGTYDTGVQRLHEGTAIIPWEHAQGLKQRSIRALLFDSDRSLWIGTSEGLVHWKNGEFELVDLFPKDSPDFILSLAKAPDASLWIGTATGLVVRHADGKIQIHDASNGYPALDTFDIQLEADGSGWLATDAGLIRYTDQGFQAIGRQQGLPSDSVFRLLRDDRDAFWLTSNRGLARIQRSEIDAVLAGRSSQLALMLLNAERGMSATQCNGGTQSAGLIANDASLWIPTANGITRIEPAQFPKPRLGVVPLVLEEIVVDGSPTSLPLTLAAQARRVEFRISGLAFVHPDDMRYQHWLQGYDDDYAASTNDPNIAYTNLPPGNYTLHIIGRQGDSGMDGPALLVPFKVNATIWRQPWFLLLSTMLGCAMIALLYFWRMRALRQNALQLKAMVASRTLELRERAEALDQANEEKIQLLAQLSHQALHDSLTSLPNRTLADQQLMQAFAAMQTEHKNLCIGLMDVDYFKQINDEYGHPTGDEVLRTLGTLLKQQQALWCARVGGEEFVIISYENAAASAVLIESLHQKIAAQVMVAMDTAPLRVTVSIGWVDASAFDSVEKAMAEADRRLYLAKDTGRNRVLPTLENLHTAQ